MLDARKEFSCPRVGVDKTFAAAADDDDDEEDEEDEEDDCALCGGLAQAKAGRGALSIVVRPRGRGARCLPN